MPLALPPAQAWPLLAQAFGEGQERLGHLELLQGKTQIPVPEVKAGDLGAVAKLKERGATNLRYLCLLAAPEGIERLTNAHPDVPIHVAAVDDHLNNIGYIVPGLGDAGDRQFGTG